MFVHFHCSLFLLEMLTWSDLVWACRQQRILEALDDQSTPEEDKPDILKDQLSLYLNSENSVRLFYDFASIPSFR